jgi:nucleoside-diphosphate-sugar epimerase
MSALRVAVIGAGGQIGQTLLGRLASEPTIDVRGICRNELTAAPLRLKGFDIRCGAVSDASAAQKLLGDCDVLVNCASATALPGTARTEERGIVRGLLSVRGPRRLIHFSSLAVYGTCITAKARFEHPQPDYPYGREKLNLETYLRATAARSHVRAREIVILRMGHVYGAEQWVSRFVFDHMQKAGWRLPFDGRHASNAIHVKNVASAVRTLALEHQTGVFNLFDSPQSTWRDVFDWNTKAVGAPRVPGLDDAASEKLRQHFGRIAEAPALELLRQVTAWGKSLPMSLASSSQQVRFVVMGLLAAVQSPKLEAHVSKRFVAGQLAGRSAPLLVEQPWIFSQQAPGPCVEFPAEVTADDARDVARWRDGYASPDALAPFAPRTQGKFEAQA